MTSTSVHQKFSGLLIVVGSLVFVCGGAFHPRINSSLGALGSVEFFQNFYMHIAHHGSWRLIHGMILAGPLMWLLGVGSFWSGRCGWSRMATTAMTLAATAWAVTFVFDGFVAPDIVHWLTPETGWHVLAVNQDVVIRLGLVSWLMLGFSIIAGGVGILVSSRSKGAKVLASVGILLGAWSFIAWATGIFLPGPLVSPYWNATAVSTAFWFLAVGVFLLVSASPQNAVEAEG
jgi:hypothetical protein